MPLFLIFTLFCRVESFIEHQDACTVRRAIPPQPLNASLTASSTSPSNKLNFSPPLISSSPSTATTPSNPRETNSSPHHNADKLELQLQPTSSFPHQSFSTGLHLSVGPSETRAETEEKDWAVRLLRLAAAEKAFAEEARKQARRQLEMAEEEFANAQKIRMVAQAELERARALKEEALRKIASAITQVTCAACRRLFQAVLPATQPCDEISTHSLVSSATTVADRDDF